MIGETAMKKLLTLMLVLSMLLTLCACGEENAEPESPEETYYWRTEAVCRYPFGLDGTISAAADRRRGGLSDYRYRQPQVKAQ